MESFTHTIQDPLGLHARPAGKVAKAASAYRCTVTVHTERGTADAKRLLSLMRLAAKAGTKLTVICDGDDEAIAAKELSNMMANTL